MGSRLIHAKEIEMLFNQMNEVIRERDEALAEIDRLKKQLKAEYTVRVGHMAYEAFINKYHPEDKE